MSQSTQIDDNIKQMMSMLEKTSKMDAKTLFMERWSSMIFLLSPPILFVVTLRQFFISSLALNIKWIYILLALLIIIGYVYHLYKESLVWMVVK